MGFSLGIGDPCGVDPAGLPVTGRIAWWVRSSTAAAQPQPEQQWKCPRNESPNCSVIVDAGHCTFCPEASEMSEA